MQANSRNDTGIAGGAAGRSQSDASRQRRARLARKVAHLGSLLWFSSQLTLGRQALVLVVVAIGVFAVSALTGKITGEREVFLVLLGVEMSFFVILSMGLLPREKDAKTLELLLVCTRSRHGLLLMKFVPVCLFVAAVGFGLAWAFHWLTGGFPMVKMLLIPYVLGATIGILTVVLSTHVRNQYAAGAIALTLAIILGITWFKPVETFYTPRATRMMVRQPTLTLNRVLLVVVFSFLYEQAVRRLQRPELWMK